MQERWSVAALTPASGTDEGRSVRRLRTLLTLGCSIAVVTVDQVTKTLAVDHLQSGPVHLLGPLSLSLAYNTGMAFSIGRGLALPIILLVVVVVLVAIWVVRGVPSVPASVALGLVLGGASGNLADRLFRNHGGAVVDFIASKVWPTFNVADASIVTGAALLGIVYWRHDGASAQRTTAEGRRR